MIKKNKLMFISTFIMALTICLMIIGVSHYEYIKEKKEFENTVVKDLVEQREIIEKEKEQFQSKVIIKKRVKKKINKSKKQIIIKNDLEDSKKIKANSDSEDILNKTKTIKKIEKLNGYAKYCWSNGDCYTGYWKDGYMEGSGCYEWTIDGVRCIDVYKKGFPINDEFEYGNKRYRVRK